MDSGEHTTQPCGHCSSLLQDDHCGLPEHRWCAMCKLQEEEKESGEYEGQLEKQVESLKLQLREAAELVKFLWETMLLENCLCVDHAFRRKADIERCLANNVRTNDTVICGNCCEPIPSSARTEHGPGKCQVARD